MTLEKRISVLANLAILLLAIFGLRVVYWQLIRAGEILPAWLSPLLTASTPWENAAAKAPGWRSPT